MCDCTIERLAHHVGILGFRIIGNLDRALGEGRPVELQRKLLEAFIDNLSLCVHMKPEEGWVSLWPLLVELELGDPYLLYFLITIIRFHDILQRLEMTRPTLSVCLTSWNMFILLLRSL